MRTLLRITYTAYLLVALAVCVVPFGAVHAQQAFEGIGTQLQAVGGDKGAGLSQVDPRVTVVFVIRSILGLLGTIVFGYFVYAGFLWMTAGGNDEQVGKAKTTIRNATIGLIVVMMSYSITLAIVDIASGWPIGTSGGPLGVLRSLINSF